MTAAVAGQQQTTWVETNRAYLQGELQRLRLLFRRKIIWLRSQWRQDPLSPGQGTVISDGAIDRLLLAGCEGQEAHFYLDDGECRSIARAIEEVEGELELMRQEVPALEALCRNFGLAKFERDVLMLCFSMDEDPAFSTLCAYVQDDAHARFPTAHLALSLFCANGEERESARRALLASSALRRFRLLYEADGGMLRIDSRVVDYLRGVQRLDERLGYLLCPVAPTPIAGAHQELVEGLVRWAKSVPNGEPWPVVLVTGPGGAGQIAVAREFCARVRLQLCALDPKRLPLQDTERHQLSRLLERETVLSQIAVYMDVSELDPGDKTVLAATRDWIERAGGVFFVAGRERWQTTRPAIQVTITKPGIAEQRVLWKRSLGQVEHSVNGYIDSIAQQFDLGPEAIPQAVMAALAKSRQRDGQLAADDLWQACREQAGWRMGDLAQRLAPCYTWDDIVLPEDVLRQLREIADQVASRPQVYESWGFGARLPRGRGISALFSGPSGTGKTMAAEIMANALKIDLYRIDLAGMVSKYIGETEKNLRNVFEAAEQSGAILFFDEADALFGKRTEVKDSHDRYANIEVNYLLQRMEDYRGLAILCTNRRSALDRAFLRRLRFLVDFPAPDWAHRRLIWQKVFPPQAPVNGLDFEALSRLDVSGGSIRNIALNAAFVAAAEKTRIGMAHVLNAARREYAKMDKLLTEAEFGGHYGVTKV